jgi:hypothetical protein
MSRIERRKSLFVIDFVGVLICAVIVGVNQDFSSHSGDEVSWANFWRTVVLAIECYAIVAVLVLPWRIQFVPKVPNWFLVVALGAIVYCFAIHFVETVSHARQYHAQYLPSFVKDFLVNLLFITILDCILTVPLMALIHFLAAKLLRIATVQHPNAT